MDIVAATHHALCVSSLQCLVLQATPDKPHASKVSLYGQWQTEPYRPPPAVGGVIPRSDYGSVDLWNGDEKLLPAGTVYLNPREGGSKIAAAAKALGVDCAPAKVMSY